MLNVALVHFKMKIFLIITFDQYNAFDIKNAITKFDPEQRLDPFTD